MAHEDLMLARRDGELFKGQCFCSLHMQPDLQGTLHVSETLKDVLYSCKILSKKQHLIACQYTVIKCNQRTVNILHEHPSKFEARELQEK